MTLLEILEEKEQRLEDIPNDLATKTDKAQKKVLKELISQLQGLDRTKGYIDISVSNIAKIQSISESLLSFIFDETEYSNALKQFAKEFNEQAKLSRIYIEGVEKDFSNKEIYKATLAQSQKQAIDLLSRSAVNQVFINPMKEILQSSISTGGSFTDAISALTDYVIGTDQKEGQLLSRVKQVAFDGFAFADRQYMKTISEDVGFEWFQYFGGRIKDSRYFCVERANGIFHKKEVQYWGETPSLWDKPTGSKFHGGGRVLETNKSTIWVYAGGYNCRHQIVPVSTTQVPASAIKRAKEKGYIK